MTTIPIILASDNNYAPYMSVLMISILKNAKSNPFIDFYLLVPESFKEKYKKTIQADCRFYKNKQINFIDMQNAFSQTKRMIAHITEQSYYRLKATEILPKEYDKCIYLDIDTIVNDDLSELFSIDIEDNYVAGVKAPGYHFPEDGNRKYCERIGIPSINQYINSGVMLLNLKKIREDNLTPTLCEEALKNYPTVDQDVINKVFYNKIKHLEFKYNAMTARIYAEDSKLLKIFTKEELDEARTTPFIIHYADKIKPWDSKNCIFADYWWKYAKLSNFYPQIIKSQIKENIKKVKDKILKNIYEYSKSDSHRTYKILGIKIKRRIKKAQLQPDFKTLIKENNKRINQQYNEKLKRITPRPYLEYIGFHLVDHCNLNCRCCDVCSPIADKRFVTLESFTNDIKRLQELTKQNIGTIILSGGEALLNPSIIEMMEVARNHFPNSKIRLQSNGILLLDKDESFWKTLQKLNITITCTKYPIKLDYDLIQKTAEKYNLDFNYFNNAEILKTSYHIPFNIDGTENPRENFINCFHANQCIGIHDGKIYTCSPAANAHHFNKYFNTNMVLEEADYIDIYKAKSIQEILAFLAEPIPFCKYCNVKGRTFGHEWGISKKEIEEWT